jgi:AraC family ethanolamine operon transcriptional activator
LTELLDIIAAQASLSEECKAVSVDLPNHERVAVLFPAGLRVAFSCRDPGEMVEQAVYWRMKEDQLGRGPFEASVRAVHSGRIQMSRARRTQGLWLRGSIPAGTVVLASLHRPSAPVFLRSARVAEHEVMLVRAEDELDFRSVGGDQQITAAVDATLFEGLARAALGPAVFDRWCPDCLALREPAIRPRLNRRLMYLLDEAFDQPDRLRHPDHGRAWEYRVLDAWLADVVAPDPGFTPAMRHRAAREAESFLRENLDRPVSIAELCLLTGAPKRTLMLGFTDSFGMPPLTLHRRLRLNAVRRDLADSRPGETTVTDAALRWGFDHFGRFSVDYHRMFGESPIATLRGPGRVRSHAPVGIPLVRRTIRHS